MADTENKSAETCHITLTATARSRNKVARFFL